MKNIIIKLKKNTIFYIIIYLFLFLAIKLILNLYHLEFRNWVYYLSIILISLIIAFTIIRNILDKKIKKIYAVFQGIALIFIEAVFIATILFGLYIIKGTEETMFNNKYVRVKYPLTLLQPYNYYSYVNSFVRGTDNINKWELL